MRNPGFNKPLRPLSMERRHDHLSFFSMDYSIIAMGFLFFVLSLSVCIVRIWRCDSLNNMSKREAFKYVQNISHGLIVVQFHPWLTKACFAAVTIGCPKNHASLNLMTHIWYHLVLLMVDEELQHQKGLHKTKILQYKF